MQPFMTPTKRSLVRPKSVLMGMTLRRLGGTVHGLIARAASAAVKLRAPRAPAARRFRAGATPIGYRAGLQPSALDVLAAHEQGVAAGGETPQRPFKCCSYSWAEWEMAQHRRRSSDA